LTVTVDGSQAWSYIGQVNTTDSRFRLGVLATIDTQTFRFAASDTAVGGDQVSSPLSALN
jgi:hypothetical protein